MKTFVTRPFFPERHSFLERVEAIFDREILTNQGPEVQELQASLKKFLGVQNFNYVTNGTVAIQLALKALGIEGGEVITTPFSYVATTSSILWERASPVFVDIEPDHFTIDPALIEQKITDKTKAILPVHVFGYHCDFEAIEEISKKYNVPVIYDAAHTFGSKYKGRSLCSYGDVSTLSFHATKLFHTIEGGGVTARDPKIQSKIDLLMRFGHNGDDHLSLGINAKQDEINAAMGNCILKEIKKIISERKVLSLLYDEMLPDYLFHPKSQDNSDYNYAYYPVLFPDEDILLKKLKKLNEADIFPRRYFYPSLNKLSYLSNYQPCEISEDISSRILCLPLFNGLSESLVKKVCEVMDE